MLRLRQSTSPSLCYPTQRGTLLINPPRVKTRKKAAPHGKRARRKSKRPSKGALIKGMSERLPISLLDIHDFREGLKEIMAGYAGVYALYRGKSLHYVGLASNLFWRLHRHTRDRHKGKWNHFSIFRISRVSYLKDIETLLLRVAVPKGNRVTGHVHRDANLSRVLRNIAREQTRSLKRIRRVIG